MRNRLPFFRIIGGLFHYAVFINCDHLLVAIEVPLDPFAITIAILIHPLNLQRVLLREPSGVLALKASLLNGSDPRSLSVLEPCPVSASVWLRFFLLMIETIFLFFELRLDPCNLLFARHELSRLTSDYRNRGRRQQGEMKRFHIITVILSLVLLLFLVLQRKLYCPRSASQWDRPEPV